MRDLCDRLRRYVPPRADHPHFWRDRWRRVSAEGIEPHAGGPEKSADPEPQQIAACRAWLREFAVPTKTIRPRASSYGYKHVVERWTREKGVNLYIANGAFIAAAIVEGYRLERTDRSSPNAFFALRVRRQSERGVPLPSQRALS
jgi:hypothetical protein